ncbi:MAG: hypothetical protein IPF95_01760 [Flavobacteriales bacterium]|nr:hypothetical protein [Flavobacteriales bacterium]MBK6944828.1 hypothetical protein [Flavobacteriales bacterium]MBK9534486.1 hypothetical protein [Flavobacteriales bacterium]MBP9139778.1 hypothetical protein [Flavobacteriales bacterium]HQV53610.1 hypothetical protein [Flavobacteriales bacterium]
MNRGILFAVVIALAWSGLTSGCRRAADTGQLTTVDSLSYTMDKMLSTLMQLDQHLYAVSDSVLKVHAENYSELFTDTLDRATADALANQYLVLREAEHVERDHLDLQREISSTQQRLEDLRNDLNSGAMDNEAAHAAIAAELQRASSVERATALIASNHFTIKRTLEELSTTDPLRLRTLKDQK